MSFLFNKLANIPQNKLKEFLKSFRAEEPKIPDYKLWYSSQFLKNAGNATVEPFLPIFAQTIGATPIEVGLLAGLFSLINISQIIWVRVATRIRKFKLPAFFGKALSGLLFIPMAFLNVGQIILLLFFRFLQGFFTSAATSTETALMAEHISKEERTARIPLFTRFSLIGAFCGTLFGGIALSWLTEELKFSTQLVFVLLFFWTGILGMLSSLIFFRSVPEYRKSVQPISPEKLIFEHTINAPSRTSWITRTRAYLGRFGDFYRICFFAAVLYFGVYLAAPFFIILEINVYQLTFFEAAILTSISVSCQILTSILERKIKLFDRFGTRYLLFPALSCIWVVSILVTVPYFFKGFPIFLWCIGIWTLVGTGWGLFNSAIIVLLFNTAHPKYRPTLLAIYSTLTGFMMFLGPIIGGALVELAQTIIIVFLIRFIFLIGAFFLLILVKDPEVPASLLYPMLIVFKRYIRTTARGGEAVIASILPRIKLKE
ncbi:MAG: MFS transporter [Promethearchaeota archaeon]